MSSSGHAEDIADDLLFQTGKALTSGDPHWLKNCFEVPFIMETQEGTRLIEAEAEILSIFDCVQRYYKKNDVVDIIRTVVSAEFIDTRTIGATSVTRLMQSGGRQFRNPFPLYSTISNASGSWKLVSSTYAILDAPEHNKALLGEIRPCFDLTNVLSRTS